MGLGTKCRFMASLYLTRILLSRQFDSFPSQPGKVKLLEEKKATKKQNKTKNKNKTKTIEIVDDVLTLFLRISHQIIKFITLP